MRNPFSKSHGNIFCTRGSFQCFSLQDRHVQVSCRALQPPHPSPPDFNIDVVVVCQAHAWLLARPILKSGGRWGAGWGHQLQGHSQERWQQTWQFQVRHKIDFSLIAPGDGSDEYLSSRYHFWVSEAVVGRSLRGNTRSRQEKACLHAHCKKRNNNKL